MMTKLYTVNLADVTSEDELHDRLGQILEAPEWYGRNMDALHDCLTDLSGRVIITGSAEAKKHLQERIDLLRQVCRDAMDENPRLWVYFTGSPE